MIEYENLGKSNASFFTEYKRVFDETLQSGWYILGARVAAFEAEFASYCNSNYCIGVANGLDALILCLRSFEFEKGHEVIVPSNTYIATILAIIHNDLVPVLVEPDIATYNINIHKIESAITSKTCAIMPVHLYGKMCDMDPIPPAILPLYLAPCACAQSSITCMLYFFELIKRSTHSINTKITSKP